LIDAAVLLDKTQIEIETGYYMIDLVKVIEAKRKVEAAEKLEHMRMILSTNNRGVEDAEYKALISEFTKRIGVKTETKFNRDKFEQLRALSG
jgi:hypothetical protein